MMHEYRMATFRMHDGAFGALFFAVTGCHGLHVAIGVMALSWNFIVAECTRVNHLMLELSVWYWHFVDAVWVLVVLSVYMV